MRKFLLGVMLLAAILCVAARRGGLQLVKIG
jgi:hypothetical protein